jgi:hypothetical protein
MESQEMLIVRDLTGDHDEDLEACIGEPVEVDYLTGEVQTLGSAGTHSESDEAS